MHSPYFAERETVQSHPLVSLLTCLLLCVGCAENAADAVCGGHGVMHAGHCHCDRGYDSADDGLNCVPEPPSEDPEPIEVNEGNNNNAQNTESLENDRNDTENGEIEGEFSFAPSLVRAATGPAKDGTQIWMMESVDGDAILGLEIYAGFGGLSEPGVTPITEAETSYATCGTCLILRTGCVAHGDHYDCLRTLMPRAGGEVRIDAISANAGEQLSGELVGLTFQEVSISADYQTQALANGAELYLESWTFDVELESLSGGTSTEACGGHGYPHGDHCDCDPGYMPNPQDPMDCVPQ